MALNSVVVSHTNTLLLETIKPPLSLKINDASPRMKKRFAGLFVLGAFCPALDARSGFAFYNVNVQHTSCHPNLLVPEIVS